MNPTTHAAVANPACGVNHEVVLIEGGGSFFLRARQYPSAS
jgi:hypothetical protein